jgi:hypothetical protein
MIAINLKEVIGRWDSEEEGDRPICEIKEAPMEP